MYLFQKLSNFKVKIVRNSWVKNNKKQKKSWYDIFFDFYCFVKKNSEVQLTITFERNMRFHLNGTKKKKKTKTKKHIKEQNLAFHIKTTPKKPFTYMIRVAPYLNGSQLAKMKMSIPDMSLP